jgi:hypothetical protein
MQTKFILLATLLISNGIHAQVSRPIPKVDNSIEDCRQSVVDIDCLHGVYNNEINFCNDKNLSSSLNSDPDIYTECVKSAIKFSNVRDELLRVCASSEVRSNLKNEGYQECLTNTNRFELGPQHFNLCLDKKIQTSVKNPNFISCFDTYKKGFPNASALKNFNSCLGKKASANVVSSSFLTCQNSLTKLGALANVAIPYCISKYNQSESNLANLRNCSKGLNSALSVPGLDYCLELNSSLFLTTDKNINCVASLADQFLYSSYFKYEATISGAELVEDFLNQCQYHKDIRPFENSTINFHDFKVIHTKQVVSQTLVGGLSGLTYDPESNAMLVVSDDPGMRNNSRLYQLDVDLENQVPMKMVSSTPIKSRAQVSPSAKFVNIDAEGIAILPNSDLVISSENLVKGSNSFLRHYDRSGNQKDEIPLPEKFTPKTGMVDVKEKYRVNEYDQNLGRYVSVEKTRTVKKKMQVSGVQANKSFESLTAVPHKAIIMTANEYPLVQDDLENQKVVRITKLIQDEKGKFSTTAEYAYPLDDKEGNGLVELVALTEHRVLTLERRFDPKKGKVTAQIFEINLSDAKNYTDVESLREEALINEIQVVSKKLLLDLDEILPSLPQGLNIIDNFEGMALGPKLPNGKDSLVLVTDNNFRPDQFSQILVLGIDL